MPANIQPGHRLSLRHTLQGNVISAAPTRSIRHPWFTRVAWDGRSRQWLVTIDPGYVNHLTPVLRTTVSERIAIDPRFGTNPLNGERYFSAHVFGQETREVNARNVDIPLYLSPAIVPQWSALGFDGDPTLPVPQFFKDRGVADPAPIPGPEQVAAGTTLQTPDRPKDLRLLRACDCYVHQPRSALTSSVTLEPGIITGQSNVKQTLSTREPPVADPLHIVVGHRTRTTQEIDPLGFDYEEQTWDEILISTVYLLSPTGLNAGAEPDLTWTPHVRHNLFWNLNWAQPAFRPLAGDPGTPLIPPLAGGAAQIIINFLTASINDATQQALNILLSHSMAGFFWTPTGGGSSAVIVDSADPVIAQRGLDKSTRLRDQRLAALRAQRALRLDPPFPFRAEAFDTRLLSS